MAFSTHEIEAVSAAVREDRLSFHQVWSDGAMAPPSVMTLRSVIRTCVELALDGDVPATPATLGALLRDQALDERVAEQMAAVLLSDHVSYMEAMALCAVPTERIDELCDLAYRHYLLDERDQEMIARGKELLSLSGAQALASAGACAKMWRYAVWLRKRLDDVGTLFGDLEKPALERAGLIIGFGWRHADDLRWLFLARRTDALEDAIADLRAAAGISADRASPRP